ncbi:hypothetical protein ACFFRR_007486 [Megaselia abdita]
MLSAKLVVLVLFVGVALGEDTPVFRNLQIPQDLGTPACLFGPKPCTPEDYKKGSEFRENFIKNMVNRYVDEDVKTPACLATKDCAKDVVETYNQKREILFKEIHDEIKKANHLN